MGSQKVQRSQAAQNTTKAPPDRKYYNCGENVHYINRCRNPHVHLPSTLITNTTPTFSEKNAKVCFHCGQSCHFALQCPDRRQRQTPLSKKYYNYKEKGHLAITCPNPRSCCPLPLSAKSAPSLKGRSTSVKAITSCFNYGQVGHFANRCPDLRQLLAPTQGNQNVARTPAYKKCYNCGQKSHFTNVCPNKRYRPDETTVATSTPNRQVNSTTSTVQQQ
jgi:hypothetical protein